MVCINLTAILNVTIIGEELEPLKMMVGLSYKELCILKENNHISRTSQEVLLDLDKELYLGRDIINIKEIKSQINNELETMTNLYKIINTSNINKNKISI